jgi:hypothetical protein
MKMLKNGFWYLVLSSNIVKISNQKHFSTQKETINEI